MTLSLTPTGPQISAVYRLDGPSGARAVFNDNTDPDYVGMLTEISGFDSPEVRESSDNLVQLDGGIHGDFFYGRRPIVLTGMLLNPVDAFERNQRANQLMLASNAMRQDAVLSWELAGRVSQQIAVRRQQPLRIDGPWQKSFQLALVAADPRIYSQDLTTATVPAELTGEEPGRDFDKDFDIEYEIGQVAGQMFVNNLGNAVTYPRITITGGITNPIITNVMTGESVRLYYRLAARQTLEIDMLNRTVLFNGSVNRYGSVDFPNTTWWGLGPGTTELRLGASDTDADASLTVEFRSAWV